jgi:hypothetical protein
LRDAGQPGRYLIRGEASRNATGGDRKDSPASSSLWEIAIAAAGPMNAKTTSANAIPVTAAS